MRNGKIPVVQKVKQLHARTFERKVPAFEGTQHIRQANPVRIRHRAHNGRPPLQNRRPHTANVAHDQLRI